MSPSTARPPSRQAGCPVLAAPARNSSTDGGGQDASAAAGRGSERYAGEAPATTGLRAGAGTRAGPRAGTGPRGSTTASPNDVSARTGHTGNRDAGSGHTANGYSGSPPGASAPGGSRSAVVTAVAFNRTAQLFDLTGRVALVTGAHSGVGQGVAIGLAEAGADLVLLGGGSAYETAAAVRAAGRSAHQVPADLTDLTAMGPICERLLADRDVDILVTDMATVGVGSRRRSGAPGWRQVLADSLDGSFVLAQLLGWPMARRRSGKVVNIASTPWARGRVPAGAPTASRNGVAALTRALAADWAGTGVQANGVVPGPPGPGDPRHLVGTVVFLASPASDHVNGQILVVDGGRSG